MARIAANVTEIIGRTPLVKLNRHSGRPARYRPWSSWRSQNPLSSVKDRIGPGAD